MTDLEYTKASLEDATPESPAIFTKGKSIVLQTLMKEEKESHHTVKYRRLKERKRLKATRKRRQTKHEKRKDTNDVLVPGCRIIPAN